VYTPGILFGKSSTNSVQDREQRERGSGDGSPLSGVPHNLQMSEPRILIRLLWMYFAWNWEFGSTLSKLRNFGGGRSNPLNPHPLYVTVRFRHPVRTKKTDYIRHVVTRTLSNINAKRLVNSCWLIVLRRLDDKWL
jgi:hypothetical protein